MCTSVQLLSLVWLFVIPWTVVCQVPLSMGFFRQEYWSKLSFPSLGDLLNLRIEPASPALQVDSLLLSHRRSLYNTYCFYYMYIYDNISVYIIKICNYFNTWSVATCTFYICVLFKITAISAVFLHKFGLLGMI